LLSDKYKIKDLGDCDWLLNMKITRDPITGDITLSQKGYVEKLLIQHGLETCNPVRMPYVIAVANQMTAKEVDSPLLSPTQHKAYRSIIGGLLYAANQTRLDIAFIVNLLCRFVAEPREIHLSAAKTVLRYLSGTKHYCLVFKSSNPPITVGGAVSTSDVNTAATDPIVIATPLLAYCDASWAGDLGDRKSTTGCVIKLFGNVVAWTTKKQSTVAGSSTEAEYMSSSDCAKDLLWMKQWLLEVLQLSDAANILTNQSVASEVNGITASQPTTATMLSDSQSCIAMLNNPLNHQKTKHIDVKYHHVRDHVAKGDIKVHWVSTHDQEADLLTKAMPIVPFQKLVSLLLTTSHPTPST
jgi:hypothetical protein